MAERPQHSTAPLPDPTMRLENGWHCLHIYYQIDPENHRQLSQDDIEWGKGELRDILHPDRPGAPERMQTSIISGHRADLGVMMMDHDPLVIDSVLQDIRSCALGSVFRPTYSFVSITEISEYVPTSEQYADRLRLDGIEPGTPAFTARLNAYEQRLPAMNKQRLYPDLPDYPVSCFYPMNKMRHPDANWFQMPFSQRSKLMAEHATSGIKFAGKVSQLITASTGFDDWEWGVTLWSRTPDYIKEIVYTMRFDEASARYAEFGSFYIGYVMNIDDALKHLKI
jgi:chlorite dismutase